MAKNVGGISVAAKIAKLSKEKWPRAAKIMAKYQPRRRMA
jgi:hypothetical protein